MKIEIKRLRENEKIKVQRILFVLIVINLLMFILSFFTGLLSFNKIIKQVVVSLIGILNIVGTIFIVFLSQKKEDRSCKELDVEYNPILIEFLRNNEIKEENNVIRAELANLINNQYVSVNSIEEDYLLTLEETEDFKRMGSLEQIGRETIQNYINDKIPCYENLFVTKVLFPFENKITLKKFEKNVKENYYHDRFEMCKYTLEKMLLYQVEKDNMLDTKKDYKFAILIILNILCILFNLASCGVFNIILLIAAIFNIGVSVIMLKNEKVLAYSFNEEVKKNVEDIEDYVKGLPQKTEKTKYDSVLEVLFYDKPII